MVLASQTFRKDLASKSLEGLIRTYTGYNTSGILNDKTTGALSDLRETVEASWPLLTSLEHPGLEKFWFMISEDKAFAKIDSHSAQVALTSKTYAKVAKVVGSLFEHGRITKTLVESNTSKDDQSLAKSLKDFHGAFDTVVGFVTSKVTAAVPTGQASLDDAMRVLQEKIPGFRDDLSVAAGYYLSGQIEQLEDMLPKLKAEPVITVADGKQWLKDFDPKKDDIITHFSATLATVSKNKFDELLRVTVGLLQSIMTEMTSFIKTLGAGSAESLAGGKSYLELNTSIQKEITRCRVVMLEAKICSTEQSASGKKSARITRYINDFVTEEKIVRDIVLDKSAPPVVQKLLHPAVLAVYEKICAADGASGDKVKPKKGV